MSWIKHPAGWITLFEDILKSVSVIRDVFHWFRSPEQEDK